MPSSLRIELDKLGYNWDSGTLVQQEGSGYQVLKPVRFLKPTDPLIDQMFSNGPAMIDMPRVMASDNVAIYIPYRDNRGSGLTRIYHKPAKYIDRNENIPYPEV